MPYLADESCDFAIVRALRNAGHDAMAVAENHAGAEDIVVAELACRLAQECLATFFAHAWSITSSRGRRCGQWVLSIPILLRILLATHTQLVSEVLQIVHHVIAAFPIKHSGRDWPTAA